MRLNAIACIVWNNFISFILFQSNSRLTTDFKINFRVSVHKNTKPKRGEISFYSTQTVTPRIFRIQKQPHSRFPCENVEAFGSADILIKFQRNIYFQVFQLTREDQSVNGVTSLLHSFNQWKGARISSDVDPCFVIIEIECGTFNSIITMEMFVFVYACNQWLYFESKYGAVDCFKCGVSSAETLITKNH